MSTSPINQIESDYKYYQKRAKVETALAVITLIASIMFLAIGAGHNDKWMIPGLLGILPLTALLVSLHRSEKMLEILEQQCKSMPSVQKIILNSKDI